MSVITGRLVSYRFQERKSKNNASKFLGVAFGQKKPKSTAIGQLSRLLVHQKRKSRPFDLSSLYPIIYTLGSREAALKGHDVTDTQLGRYFRHSLRSWNLEIFNSILSALSLDSGRIEFLSYFTQWIEQNDLRHLGDYLKQENLNLVSTTGPSLASAVYYLDTKGFVTIPSGSKIYKNAEAMAQGLANSEVDNPCLILDEALIHQLKTCEQLKELVSIGQVKLLCLEGFMGVPNFSTNTELNLLIKNLIQLEKNLERSGSSMIESCRATYKKLVGAKVDTEVFEKVEFISNPARLPSNGEALDLWHYYNTLFLTDERLQQGLDRARKFFPEDVWKVLRRIILANSEIYSYRTLIPQLKTMHKKVLDYVQAKKLDSDNIYFCTVQKDFRETDPSKVKVKSDCLLAHLYSHANDVPADRFIADISQIPEENRQTAVVVFIDDFTASGQTPAVKIHDFRKTGFEGHIIVAQLYSNPWITKLMQLGNYFAAFQKDESFPERLKKLGTEPLTRDDNAGFISVQEHSPLWLSGLTGNSDKKLHFQQLLRDGGLDEEQINQLSELLINFPEDEKQTILNKLNWFVSEWLQSGYALSNPYMCPDNNNPIISIFFGLLGLKNLSSIKLDETLDLGKTLGAIADNPEQLLQIGFQGLTSKMEEDKAPN